MIDSLTVSNSTATGVPEKAEDTAEQSHQNQTVLTQKVGTAQHDDLTAPVIPHEHSAKPSDVTNQKSSPDLLPGFRGEVDFEQ